MADKFTELHNVGSVFYARVSSQRAKVITDLQAAEVDKATKDKSANKRIKASKQQAIIDDVANLDWLKHPVKVGDTVVLETGETVGTVKSIQHGVGQSLLSVTPVDTNVIASVDESMSLRGLRAERSRTKQSTKSEQPEYLIPLVADFVVNQTANTLTMKLPEGLLDL